MPKPDDDHRFFTRTRRKTQLFLDELRHQLAHLDALPQLTILGFITGLAAAGVIVVFRLCIDLPLMQLFNSHSEDFESLPRHWYFLMPVIGALLLALMFMLVPEDKRQVSVGHVLVRLNNHQGRLPLTNWVLQFFGGILALISGQSMGREGPAVHLGAGIASQLGQWLILPNNCLRTLIGCGVASAISASFNTPMAGVIFSMEVVLMEYTIAGFIPVIMASVTGAMVCQLIFGPEPAFAISPPQLNNFLELPFIMLTGLVIALFAAAFIRIQLFAHARQKWPLLLRLPLAGLVTGSLAFWYPQILGIGYDTLEATMRGEIVLQLLMAIVVCKLIATAVSGGLGIPGGIIGPTLFIGAALGGCMGIIGNSIMPEHGSSPSFYVLLGMSAMMAAVINAPLTALMTVFELTQNPHTVFPTMLIVVVTVITTRQLFRCNGIFIAQLEASGFSLNTGPVRQALNRIGVRSVMETRFLSSSSRKTISELQRLLQQHPKWIVIDEPEKEKFLISAADISAYMDTLTTEGKDGTEEDPEIKILDIPGRKWLLKPIHQQASLFEAQQLLAQHKADALYVERHISRMLSPVIGIVTEERIMNYYQS